MSEKRAVLSLILVLVLKTFIIVLMVLDLRFIRLLL